MPPIRGVPLPYNYKRRGISALHADQRSSNTGICQQEERPAWQPRTIPCRLCRRKLPTASALRNALPFMDHNHLPLSLVRTTPDAQKDDVPKVLFSTTDVRPREKLAAPLRGARSVKDVEVTVKRVPETMPPDVAKQHGRTRPGGPVASQRWAHDAILFVRQLALATWPHRRNFLDQTGSLWVKGALVGKVGSVFTSTGTGGGNESTIISFVNTLMRRHDLCRVAVCLSS